MIWNILTIFTAISILTGASIKFSVPKDAPIDSEVGILDADAKILTRTSYFKFDQLSGRLSTNRILDDSTDDQLLFLFDSKKPNFTVVDIEMTNTVKSKVFPIDVMYRRLEIYENVPIGTKFSLHIANIEESSGFELQGDFSTDFSLDNELFLVTKTLLDREMRSNYKLFVRSRGNDILKILIEILDVNDNYPQFITKAFETIVRFGDQLPKFTAADLDKGLNALISYHISGNSTDQIDIDPFTGQIILKFIDRACFRCTCKSDKCTRVINFRIFASDHGNPKLTSHADCTIKFIDYPVSRQKLPKIFYEASTRPPKLGYNAYEKNEIYTNLKENSPIGSFVVAIANFSTNFAHRISNGDHLGWFQIGEKNGILTTKKEVDYEVLKEIQLEIQLLNKTHVLSTCIVYIKIIDVDDNAPIFEKSFYNFTIMENLAPGSKISTFKANDVDSIEIVYSFAPKMNNLSIDGYFFIDSNTGELHTVKGFDFADISVFSFQIFAISQKFYTSCQVKIYLSDTNNHRPKFSPLEYFVNVKPTTKEILRLKAYDLDSGDYGKIEYFLFEDPFASFHIDPYTGVLYSRKKLQNFTKLIIGARDWGNLQASNNATVNIFASDDHERQSPKFIRPNFIFFVKEKDLASPNYVVGSVSTIDKIGKSKIEYKIISDHKNFMIGRYSGEIRIRSPLKCDLCEYVNFVVVAILEQKSTSSAAISIKIQHESRTVRIFKKHYDTVEVHASYPIGVPFYYPQVIDRSTTIDVINGHGKVAIDSKSGGLFFTEPACNSNITIFANLNNNTDSMILVIHEIAKMEYAAFDSDYYLDVAESTSLYTVLTKFDYQDVVFLPNNMQDSDLFGISADGTIFVKNQPDFEKISHFSLPFTINFDHSKRSSILHFNIIDVNDYEPVCDDRTSVFDVFEEMPPNSLIGIFRATDLDSIVSYYIPEEMQPYFAINPKTGQLTSKFKFDYEILEQKSFDTYVTVKDGNFTVNCPLKIRILNSNDNQPIFTRNYHIVEIYENVGVNSTILTLGASDQDHDQLKFQLDVDRNFAIDEISGRIYTKAHFDRELKDEYEILAKVSDGKHASNATILIRILDYNDHSPEFDIHATPFLNVSKSTAVGTLLHHFHASDLDIGLNSHIHYSILSGNEFDTFFLDPLDGNLILLKELKLENYSLVVRAEDHGLPKLFKDINFNINTHIHAARRPMINFNSTFYTIDQNSRPGTQIAQISGVGSFYKILYQAPTFNTFSILDGKTGQIYLNENLKSDFYNILLEVEYFSSKMTQLLTFVVIRNKTKSENTLSLSRNIVVLNSRAVQSGQRIASFNQTDLQIIGDDESGKLFEISANGDLFIKRSSLIYKPTYRLTISNNRNLTFGFTVLLTNSKYSNVKFERNSYEFTVDIGNTTEIGQVRAAQITNGRNLHFAKFEYFLADVRSTGDILPYNIFTIDDSGMIRIVPEFLGNFEDLDQVMLKIFAVDILATEPQTAECLVDVRFVKPANSMIKFTQLVYDFSIAENSSMGSTIGRLEFEKSPLKKPHTSLKFYLAEQSEQFLPFILNPEDGVLSLERLIDREKKSDYSFSAMITDGQSVSYAIVCVRIEDINDNAPYFDQKNYSFKIRENVAEGTFVGKINAHDSDNGIFSRNGQISYFFDMAETDSPFRIDSKTGVLFTKSMLDAENIPLYKLKVWATDLGEPSFKTAVDICVEILDENDNMPILSQKEIELIIPEDSEVGFNLAKVEVTDADLSSEFQFEIWTGNVNGAFSIDRVTGNLEIANRLDRETLSNYTLLVKVYDAPTSKSIRNFDICRISISLSDVNDNGPIFSSPMFLSIPLDSPIMSRIFQLEAFDPDLGDNGLHEFSIAPDHQVPFVIDHVTGNVLITSSLKETHYIFTVVVFDKFKPELKSYANLTVEIFDQKNSEPRFFGDYSHNLQVFDNLTTGSIVTRFQVKGAEEPYFWLRESKFFDVDPYLGFLYLIRPLDSSNSHNFSVFVGAEFENSTDKIDLILEIMDTNNHAPMFKRDPYVFSIGENFPVFSAKIGQVEAIDQDYGLNSKLSYAITRGNLSQFSIDPLTGHIKVNGPLDREVAENYLLTVEASDAGDEKLVGMTTVIIKVIDLNDNDPKFEKPYYNGLVVENVPVGTMVMKLSATDPDSGENGEMEYILLKSNEEIPFTIDPTSGVLYTSSHIDREFKDQYHFIVRVYDNGLGHKLYSDSNVTVTVLDVNDNTPIIKAVKQDVALKYPSKSDDIVYVVDASDPDLNENGSLSFSIFGQDAQSFIIDTKTGVIKSEILDLRLDSYALDVNVQDGGGKQASFSFRFFFRMTEDCPEFIGVNNGVVFILPENSRDTEITSFKAMSHKAEPFGRISYSITPSSLFHIDADSGILISAENLDFDSAPFSAAQQLHDLWVSASDNDSPSCSVYLNIKIKVEDVNDNVPFFEKAVYEVDVQEEQLAPINILKVKGHDADSGENARLSYSIIDNKIRDFFHIDGQTGQISTLRSLDYETLNKYEFFIQVEDHGSPVSLSSRSLLKVYVDDINDNAPKFTRIFTASVAENSNFGTFVAQITSVDADGPKNSNNTYSLISGKNPFPFKIDPSNGTVWLSGHLDRELEQNYGLKIAASDGTWHVETTLSIRVLDQNDNDPVFDQSIYIFNISSNQEEFSIGRIFARDADEPGTPNSRISYRLTTKSAVFDIDPHSGALYIRKMLKFDPMNFASNFHQFYVSAYDCGRPVRFSSTLVVLRVVESNVYAPIFEEKHYVVAIPMVIHSNLDLITVKAVDLDQHSNVYYKEYGTWREFTINSVTGTIHSIESIQSQPGQVYHLSVMSYDNGNPSKFSMSNVTLIVLPDSTTIPKFQHDTYSVVVPENIPINSSLLILSVLSSIDPILLDFEIDPVLCTENFHLDRSGNLTLIKELDYEFKAEYSFNVTIKIRGFGSEKSRTLVSIKILDIDDNKPIFKNSGDCQIAENSAFGQKVCQIEAIDADTLQNNKLIDYHLIGDPSFTINSSGSILVNAKIDFEHKQSFGYTVVAFNPQNTDMASEMRIKIHVLDTNEFSPKFTKNYSKLFVPINERKVQMDLAAIDKDAGRYGKIFYFLKNSNFSIDDDRNLIIKTNYTVGHKMSLLVGATNYPMQEIDYAVLDIEFIEPLDLFTFKNNNFNFTVAENVENGTFVGRTIFENYLKPYLTLSEDLPFRIDENGSIFTTGNLDRETVDFYEFKVFAKHMTYGLEVAQCSIRVKVLDVNDNAPYLRQKEFHVLENEPAHINITQLQPFDADSDHFEFLLLNSTDTKFFDLHPKSGLLRGKISFDREKRRKYDLNIQIYDDGWPKLSQTSQISIYIDDQNDNAPSSTNLHIFANKRNNLKEKTEKLASIEPNDLDDTAGYYSCYAESSLGKDYHLERNCDLYSNRSERSTFTVKSNDGIHENVTYNVTITILDISDTMVNECRFFLIDQSKFYASLNKLMTNGRILSFNKTARDMVELCYYGPIVESLKIKPSLCKLNNSCLNGGGCKDLNLIDTNLRSHVRLNSSHILSFNPISQSYRCLCNSEFSGTNCEMPINYCIVGREQCKNGGKCSENACQCPKNFAGRFCEMDINECQNFSNPCQNGAHCEDTFGSFKCHCPPGFQGPRCSTPSQDCASRQCLNGATCLNRGSDFICQCPFGYYGKFCEMSSLGFDQSSYMLTRIPSNSVDIFDIEFEFSTLINEGILMSAWSGDDFLAIYVADGRLNTKFVIRKKVLSNMQLDQRVNDAKFYKFRMIIDKMDNLTIELSPCPRDRCRKSSRVPSYLKSMFINRFVCFGKHNLTLNGQNSFIGCLKNFTSNGQNLEIVEKSFISDKCPRKKEILCGPGVCSGRKCYDYWTTVICACEDGTLAPNCSRMMESSFLQNGYLQYDFRSIPKIDDNRPGLISIDFTTITPDGLILSASQGKTVGILAKLFEGKLRLVIDSREISTNISQTLNDGEWHRLIIYRSSINQKITLKVDGYEEQFIHASEYSHNSDYVNFHIGGEDGMQSFSGCFRRFIVDGILMPVKSYDENSFVKVNAADGTKIEDCASRLKCRSNTVIWERDSCTSESQSSQPIAAICLSTVFVLTVLVSIASLSAVRYRTRYTKPKLNTVIVNHLPSRIDKNRFADLKMMNISSSIESCTNRDSGIGGVLAESVEILNRPQSKSNSSYDHYNSSSILNLKAEYLRNQRVYHTDGCDTSNLGQNSNKLQTENISNNPHIERYDLDNASSIASSDTDIVRHYSILRTSSRQNLPVDDASAITPSKNSATRKNRRRHNHINDFRRESRDSINRKIVENSTSDENRRPISSSAKRRRKSSHRRKSQSPVGAGIFRRRSSSSSNDLTTQYGNCYRNQDGEIWVQKPANRDFARTDRRGMLKDFYENNRAPLASVRQQFFVDDTETESECKLDTNNGITLPGCRGRGSEISGDERVFTHDELDSKRSNMEAYV